MMKISELYSIEDKVIVITGASQGIGKSLAALLVENGAKVALVARNKEKLHEVKTELGDDSVVSVFPSDITEVDQLSSLAENINQHFGRIDILINNAGTNVTKPAIEVSEEDWDKVLDLNLKSAFFLSQAIYPYFQKQSKGKIINISSQMAEVGYFKRAAYSSSKGGIKQLTKALAVEWASDNILVNAIGPTFIDTPLTAPMFKDKEFKNDVYSRIPLKKLAAPEDLYGAVIYLCSEASDMVTGHSLYVDGGWTSW